MNVTISPLTPADWPAVRAIYRMPIAAAWIELRHIALVAIASALCGALVWKIFRRIDATYARTHRDRDAALEGIT